MGEWGFARNFLKNDFKSVDLGHFDSNQHSAAYD